MRKYLILFSAIVLLLLLVFLPRSFSNDVQTVFKITKGEGSREISLNLQKEKIIVWAPLFRIYVLTAGVSGKLQAGSYFLSPSMNMFQIAGKLASGETAKMKITIPEGQTAEDIYQKVKDAAGVSLAELREKEGYLFPDTYEIPYGISGQDLIEIMVDNFNEKVTADLKAEIKRQGKTLEEIVIMASVLEKEVKTIEEKKLASGILWKRLQIGMALQVDVAPETYQRRGLPQSAVCNPGLDSIVAAVYPKASQYWYYLSTPEGQTIFSRTLQEHNIAKAKYLK